MTSTLHFTNAWHPTSGGIRTFYLALMAEAERQRRHMALVVPGRTSSVETRGEFTRIYSLAAPRTPVLDRRYRAILPHRFVFPIDTQVTRILEAERPDVVEVSDKYSLVHLAGLIKRRRGRRATVVGLSQERMDDSLSAHVRTWAGVPAFAQWYLRTVYLRQFDAHIANSMYTAAELHAAAMARGPERPLLWRLRDRIFVVPLGADTEIFTPTRRSESVRNELLRQLGAGPDTALVVFAGRLSPEKHAAEVVPAVRRAIDRGANIRCVMVGSGPLAEAIAHDIRTQAPGSVLLHGHIEDRVELAGLVASADIFLHPNPREPFGIGPVEAMASGTPIVLPRSGGVLTYATDENAWLVSPGPEGLAEGLLAVLAAPDEARRRAHAAREDAERLSWPCVAQRYFETYDIIHARRQTVWSPAASYGRTSAPLTIS